MGGVYVDGYDPVQNAVLEFQGFLFHGCVQCFPNRQAKYPFNCLTMETLYQGIKKKKIKKLKKKHKVIQIWEHQYDKMYKEDLQFKALVDSLYSHRDPLKPREVLYGGRTNVIKLYHVTQGHDQMKYIDMCSLYSFIYKHGVFPVSHPEIYTKEEIDLSQIRNYQGFIKCQILPPTDVYLPILPYRCNGKSLFSLCARMRGATL